MTKKNKQYIGRYEISALVDDGDNFIVNFKDHDPLTLKKELFEIVARDVKNKDAGITDIVNHVLATKFLSELADYGLEYYMVEAVGMAMRTLAHNAREQAIREKFECSGGDAIRLDQLI